MRCIWCNDPNFIHSNCGLYTSALKESIITFREWRIKDAAIHKPLETNFGNGGMKELMDKKLDRASLIHAQKAKTNYIEVGQSSVAASSKTSYEMMIKKNSYY